MIAAYVRVSTAQQNLDRQLTSTQEYAQEALDAALGDVRVFRDKSTGTNTERSQYQALMAQIEDGEVTAVVVHEISRLARSLQDLEKTIDRATDHGAEVHFVRDGLTFGGDEDPMSRLQLQMLGAFAEWEARVKRLNTREGIAARQESEDYHHGPAPLGFEKEDGRLYEAENYDTVCGVLESVERGNLSKRKAKDELDTSHKTINRCLQERRELYGL